MSSENVERFRQKLFNRFPAALALDGALRSNANPTPLFYMAPSRLYDLRDCWWALGRLGPALERQFSLAGEVIFLFTPYDDLQSRTHNAVTQQLRSEITEHLRDVEGFERFSPDPYLALLWSPDTDMTQKLETWNATGGSAIAQIPTTYPAEQTKALEELRDSIERVLSARDLYRGKNPVSGNDFFGRQEVLKHLQAELGSGRSVGLFGLRRSGKTSVIKEFKRRGFQQNVLVVDYDLESVGTMSEIPRQLGRALTDRLREVQATGLEVWIGSESDQETASFGDLSSRLIRTAEKNREFRFVVAIDEIEYLTGFTRTNPSEVRQFFGALRGAAQTSENLSLLLTGVTTKYFSESVLDERTQEGNPMFKFVEEVYLTPFKYEETANLLQKLGRSMMLHWEDEALVAVQETAGGMPLLVRELASYARGEAIRRDLRDAPGHIVVDGSSVMSATDAWREPAYELWIEVVETLDIHHPLPAQLIGDITTEELGAWIDSCDAEGLVAARNLERLGMLERVGAVWRATAALTAMHRLGAKPNIPVADMFEAMRARSDSVTRISDLISGGETDSVEFKDRVKINAYTGSADQDKNTLPVMKTIAAFANGDGGMLLIGVENDKTLCGIDDELKAMSKDLDGYELFIRDSMRSRLTGSHGVDGVAVSFATIDDKIVCVVDVKPSDSPIWFTKSKDEMALFTRNGNQTIQLTGPPQLDYIRRRF